MALFRRNVSRPGARRLPRWYYLFMAIVALSTLTASTAVGLLIGYIHSLPPIERLEDYTPPQSTLVYDRSGGRQIGQFSRQKRRVVTIDEIPDRLKLAFLAIEDDHFYSHIGIDLKAILRGFVTNLKAGRIVQGGSTITMQLPRNILPERVSRERKISRKIKEALLTFQIERRYSKDQILEFYLNHIFMGRHSYGVYAAAETYFSKRPEELTLAECATLAGIPKGPSIYNPLARPELSKKRRDLVLYRMRQLGWISEDEYERAVAEPMKTRPSQFKSNVAQSAHPYFLDALERNLMGNYELSRTKLRESGWSIRAAVDAEYQRIVEEELRKGLERAERMWNEKKRERFWKEAEAMPGAPRSGQTRLMKITAVAANNIEVQLDNYAGSIPLPEELPYYNPEEILKRDNLIDVRIESVDHNRRRIEGRIADETKLQGAVVMLDVPSGEVLALAGGADFHDVDANGQYNRAIMGGKPAGSTVKPFFYATAFQQGYGPHDMIVDQEVVYRSFPTDYKPQNYENRFFGPTTLIEALQHSRNVVTIRLFEALGVGRALDRVIQFDMAPGDAEWRSRFRPELSMALGSVDMSAMELAAAYLTFANLGVERSPRYFMFIADEGEDPVLRPRVRESIVIDPAPARQITYILEQATREGTGRYTIGERFKDEKYPAIAGKTGTTNNTTNAWYVGYTPDLVMVVYVGFDALKTLGPGMTGGRVAGPIWADIYERIFETRSDWKQTFDAPPGTEYADICAETGKRYSSVCARNGHATYRNVPYARGKMPREECDNAPRPPLIEPAPKNADETMPVVKLDALRAP